jgi:hypothetical protein
MDGISDNNLSIDEKRGQDGTYPSRPQSRNNRHWIHFSAISVVTRICVDLVRQERKQRKDNQCSE